KAENEAGRFVRKARAAGLPVRSHSYRGIFPYAAPSEFLRPADELRPNRQLVRSELHRFGGGRQVHARHFEHHAPGFHDSHPMLRWTFALSHSSFSRLFGERLVRKNTNPELSTALDEACDSDARRF